MELSDLTVRSFFELLGSGAPAPGGGSAAAVGGALGAALAEMVCSLTVGRTQYAEFQEDAAAAREKSAALRADFLDAMQQDADAFNRFSATMNLPAKTADEKAARAAERQQALTLCITAPLRMMELSLEAIDLVDRLPGKTNAAAVSDLGVAALMLGAAAQSAWMNVRINLGSLENAQQAAAYRAAGEALLSRTLARSRAVCRQVYGVL